ncbi:MAG: purine-nucleoside phosphorylase [Eubacterium sp.]|nr:purine-nucleoside phosphorylase [Eubacterium sp.]
MRISPSACIQLKEGTHIAKCVLMPGDPLRAKFIAETYLENPVLFNDVRNMLGYTGTFQGKEVSVMGSGMGIPSMVLYAHELYNFFGVDTIIRVGSAGALQRDVKLKSVVIPESAVTNSSCIEVYGIKGVPKPYADKELLKTARMTAEGLNIPVDVGTVFTTDYFYNPDENVNEKARKRGLLAVEMETAGLYQCAIANQKRALSILSISDNIATGEMLPPEEIREGFHDMMQIALITGVCTL